MYSNPTRFLNKIKKVNFYKNHETWLSLFHLFLAGELCASVPFAKRFPRASCSAGGALPYDLSVPAGHCDTHGTDEKFLAGGEASPTWLQDHEECDWIDFVNGLVWGKFYRKPWISPLNMGFSCKFSLKPIYWFWLNAESSEKTCWLSDYQL